jgi:predicted transcriptional regulator of viral defense system
MYDEGYIAFQNALNIYGFSEYFPFTIFVATRNISKTTPLLEDYEIKAIKIGRRFCGFEKYYRYKMSTKAKTFFDCFCHPEYAAGYPHVLKCLEMAEEIDWKEMEGYLDKFGTSSLCQKIGYMISLLCKETEFKEPTDFLEYLKSRVKSKTKLRYALDGGEYNKDWKVIDNVGKRNLLAWWYNG